MMNKSLILFPMKKALIFILLAGLSLACSRPSNYVKISTNYGDIVLELYDETPLHRDNFQKLVQEGFYDDLLFHRVIKDFMIQGGDPESKGAAADARLGSGGPGYDLPAELAASERCYHKRGALAAARESDALNPERRSSGSQFYIVVGRTYTMQELHQMEQQRVSAARQRYFNLASIEMMDSLESLRAQGKDAAIRRWQQTLLAEVNHKIEEERERYYMSEAQKKSYVEDGGTPHLDGAYTVFGEVISGMEVVERISQTATNAADRPMKDVTMKMKFLRKP